MKMEIFARINLTMFILFTEKGINESNYIFIEPSNFQEQPTTVLEFGFGTGLNFLLTLYKFQKTQQI